MEIGTDKIALLNNHVVSVTFTKKDGSNRVMKCTRNMSIIPESFHPKGTGVEKHGIVCVFDVEIHEWRSFRPESVTSFEVVD